jgi:hypothetical protein
LARSPRTTLYFYDDTPQRDSDHDPNLHGVVCAIDIMAGYGLDLHALSREIVAAQHPECAYVIYNRQIASRNTGWKWVAYTGKNPHTDHIHVSVGVGPDGYKEPPYDSTRPWLGDDMNQQEHDWLLNLFNATFYGGPSCGPAVDDANIVNPESATAKKYKNSIFSQLKQIRADQAKILSAVQAGGGDGDCAISAEQLEALATDVADRLRAITFVAQS